MVIGTIIIVCHQAPYMREIPVVTLGDRANKGWRPQATSSGARCAFKAAKNATYYYYVTFQRHRVMRAD